jgi:hypothetical protein
LLALLSRKGSQNRARTEVSMDDILNSKCLCTICREETTTIHAEADQGGQVFVCEKCLETAKQNFIWICMHCGSVYIRPKSLVLKRLTDPELKRAYAQCEGLQIIQGIDRCIECDPDGIVEAVAAAKSARIGGTC